jgi:Na+-translocating ferredoxin:NAD+ oxidoreductase RnfD subunit
LTDVERRRLPKWPLPLALSLLSSLEIFFIVMLSAEGDPENTSMIVNSIGLLVFCALTWRRVPWARWLLVGFLLWRVVRIVVDISTHFAPGDHRLGGTLMLLAFYVLTGALIASPLGRSKERAAA